MVGDIECPINQHVLLRMLYLGGLPVSEPGKGYMMNLSYSHQAAEVTLMWNILLRKAFSVYRNSFVLTMQ
jgi:hypothetical protein